MVRYNLITSQADRIKFDETRERYAKAMLDTLSIDLAMVQVPKEYAEVGWKGFVIDLEQGIVEVDDLEEAKARFTKVFVEAVKDWQEATLMYGYEPLRIGDKLVQLKQKVADLFKEIILSEWETFVLLTGIEFYEGFLRGIDGATDMKCNETPEAFVEYLVKIEEYTVATE